LQSRQHPRTARAAYGFNRGDGRTQRGIPEVPAIAATAGALVHLIDLNIFVPPETAASGAYAESSAGRGLTLREPACFPSAMTQRSIQQPDRPTARRAEKAVVIAQAERIHNIALAALVLVVVVVLITPFTGAG
jgi:hypothetical protein